MSNLTLQLACFVVSLLTRLGVLSGYEKMWVTVPYFVTAKASDCEGLGDG